MRWGRKEGKKSTTFSTASGEKNATPMFFRGVQMKGEDSISFRRQETDIAVQTGRKYLASVYVSEKEGATTSWSSRGEGKGEGGIEH